MKKVSTHLMFQDGAAQAALDLYGSVFPAFTVAKMERYGEGEGATPGWIKQAHVSFSSHSLVVIDSPIPHDFAFTPSMSLFVDFEAADDLETAFAKLSEGGQVMMPVDDYGFSRKFGWLTDRFGVSWQLNLP